MPSHADRGLFNSRSNSMWTADPNAIAIVSSAPASPGNALAPPRLDGEIRVGPAPGSGAFWRNISQSAAAPFCASSVLIKSGPCQDPCSKRKILPAFVCVSTALICSKAFCAISYQLSPVLPKSPAAATISHFSARVSATYKSRNRSSAMLIFI